MSSITVTVNAQVHNSELSASVTGPNVSHLCDFDSSLNYQNIPKLCKAICMSRQIEYKIE